MAKFAKKAEASNDEVKQTKFASAKISEDRIPKAPKAKPEAKAAKVEKAEKPAKAAKAKAEPKERAERVSKEDTRKIKVHTKVNPHREGTGRHAAYEAAKTSKTVSDYMETGNKGKYLKGWEEAGFIELA